MTETETPVAQNFEECVYCGTLETLHEQECAECGDMFKVCNACYYDQGIDICEECDALEEEKDED